MNIFSDRIKQALKSGKFRYVAKRLRFTGAGGTQQFDFDYTSIVLGISLSAKDNAGFIDPGFVEYRLELPNGNFIFDNTIMASVFHSVDNPTFPLPKEYSIEKGSTTIKATVTNIGANPLDRCDLVLHTLACVGPQD